MVGTDAVTGKRVVGIDRLRQSVADILATPKGTRVMRRDYGSLLPRLVDAPLNNDTLLQMYRETGDAIKAWEPEYLVEKVKAEVSDPGSILLTLVGKYLPEGKTVTLDGIVVKRG